MVATIDSTIWERVLVEPSGEVITPEAARALLAVKFKQSDVDRMNELAALARAGNLTTKLQAEAEPTRA